ncbi:hypothetical protein V6N13_045721 [Hibiscus sabdariffa]|uniref:Uncharacterized protein n=2 Tax=Hibiscus sabdariffa TaxID=183260 RepID=A0ABR2BDT0_9ROSI
MMTFRGQEKEGSRSPETEISGDFAWNLSVLLSEPEDESELSDESLVEEEKLEEIMQELYREITTTTTSSSSHNTSPVPLSPPPFSAVSGESCGASISDSSSTVMAGIEFVSPIGQYFAMNELTNNIVGGGGEERGMDGCDEGEIDVDDDDQWLASVLGWVPMDLEEGVLEKGGLHASI